MLFSEIYGTYYQTVAAILREAVRGSLDGKTLNRIVLETAFEESLLTIPDALRSGRWALIDGDYGTALLEEPRMPLTTLQKQWMKALLLDPRVQLFAPDETGLEDVEPLFRPEWIHYFDRYADGDPYTEEAYIRNFRTVCRALRERRKLEVTYLGGKGSRHHAVVSPRWLEYSEKDDRFRLIAVGARSVTINLGRMTSCAILEDAADSAAPLIRPTQTLTLELTDERNTLERVLLHFSHLEKETRRLDGNRYEVILRYDEADETEMLIRVLSFGATVRVTAPEHFRAAIVRRLEMQGKLRENL